MTMYRFIEEPYVVKITRTVLKTSGTGDGLAEFNSVCGVRNPHRTSIVFRVILRFHEWLSVATLRPS